MKLFGEYLVEIKLISQEQLLEAVLTQVESLPTIPSILKNNNLMMANDILAAMKHQVQFKMDFKKSAMVLNLWSDKMENEVQLALGKVRIPLGEILISLGHLKMEDMTRSLQEYLSMIADASEYQTMLLGKDELEALQTLLDENHKKSFTTHLIDRKVQAVHRDLKKMISAFRIAKVTVGEQVCVSLDQVLEKTESRLLETNDDHWNAFRPLAEKVLLTAWTIKDVLLESKSETKWRKDHHNELASLKKELFNLETMLSNQRRRVS